MFGSPSCAFPPHRHVEDLLESFEVVGLEVEGDLPLLLQQWNGGQEIVSCYLVFCFEVISRFPWTCKYANIILCFKNSVSYTHLNAATSFPLIPGLLLRLPPTEKNEENTREPRDEVEQSHAGVNHKELSVRDSRTFCIFDRWTHALLGNARILRTFGIAIPPYIELVTFI